MILFSFSHERRLRLPATNMDGVGINAAADSLALVPLPPALWRRITKEGGMDKHFLDRAYWETEAQSYPTLPRFTG